MSEYGVCSTRLYCMVYRDPTMNAIIVHTARPFLCFNWFIVLYILPGLVSWVKKPKAITVTMWHDMLYNMHLHVNYAVWWIKHWRCLWFTHANIFHAMVVIFSFTGESGIVYRGYLNTREGNELVAIKTGKRKFEVVRYCIDWLI